MRNGTLYGAKVKKAYAKLRHDLPSPRIPEPDNPLWRLAIAILGVRCGDVEARRAIDRALTTLVDWNEIRVSSALELNKAMGNAILQGTQQCQRLIEALQAVFDRENRLSLDHLCGLGRREARHYLDQLAGVDEYVVASVLLWSLGGHAVPVNDKLLKVLREAELVHPSADRAEVQSFLERHIGAADVKEFCMIMPSLSVTRRTASRVSKTQSAVRKKSGTKSK